MVSFEIFFNEYFNEYLTRRPTRKAIFSGGLQVDSTVESGNLDK